MHIAFQSFLQKILKSLNQKKVSAIEWFGWWYKIGTYIVIYCSKLIDETLRSCFWFISFDQWKIIKIQSKRNFSSMILWDIYVITWFSLSSNEALCSDCYDSSLHILTPHEYWKYNPSVNFLIIFVLNKILNLNYQFYWILLASFDFNDKDS